MWNAQNYNFTSIRFVNLKASLNGTEGSSLLLALSASFWLETCKHLLTNNRYNLIFVNLKPNNKYNLSRTQDFLRLPKLPIKIYFAIPIILNKVNHIAMYNYNKTSWIKVQDYQTVVQTTDCITWQLIGHVIGHVIVMKIVAWLFEWSNCTSHPLLPRQVLQNQMYPHQRTAFWENDQLACFRLNPSKFRSIRPNSNRNLMWI